MKISPALSILLVAFILQLVSSAECPASHLDLVNNYTLGKQDELNRTFTKIMEKLKDVGKLTHNSSATTSYTIFNTKPTFFYRDSMQKAQILGNDTISISGGKVQAQISFNWTKTNVITRNGSGIAFGLSDEIAFAKQIIVQNVSSYSYSLLDNNNVTWTIDPFNIRRVDPADTSDEDKAVLTLMLNTIPDIKTIRILLQEELLKVFKDSLSVSLHDEHHHIDPQFNYNWSPGRNQSNITISMKRRLMTIDIEKDGIRTTFDVQADGAANWTCGNRAVPLLPLSADVYGTQQYISLDFYQNMIKHAASNGYLNTDLERQSWQSTMFQFFAGDLYEVFPALQKKYYASQKITGNCKATGIGLKVWKSTFDTFNVSIHFDCELNVNRSKLISFGVGLTLEIQGAPTAQFLNFRLRSHTEFPSFYPSKQYQMQNEQLATLMVKHSVNRLYQRRLFGSGWPTSPPRDYPHFILEENYTTLYDSTHVDPHPPPKNKPEYFITQ